MTSATAQLGDIARIDRTSVAPEDIADGTLYVGLENVVNDGTFSGVSTVAKGDLASNKFCFTEKHILFGKLRPYLRKIALPDFAGICSTDILPIRPGPKVHRNYLYHFLRTPDVIDLATARSSGANLPRLNPGVLAEFEVPLPPLDEQRRIAEILDRADSLRQKRRLALQKLDTLLQSIFIDMFGDPIRNPKGWKLGTLGDVIHSAKDGPHVSPSYVDEGIPFLSTRNIRRGRIDWDDLKYLSAEDAAYHWKKCKPARGDILYTKGGTTGIAKVVDFDREVAVWVHVALLKTNQRFVDSVWLENMLNSAYCYTQSQRYTHGIANRDLGLKRMVQIKMYIPPIDEQSKFANLALRLKKLENRMGLSEKQSDALFASSQNRAFTGELFQKRETAHQIQS